MGQKAKKTSSPKSTASSAKTAGKKPAAEKRTSARQAASSKKKVKGPETDKQNAPKSRKSLSKKAAMSEAKSKKSPPASKPAVAAADPPVGLLRHTKSSEAALKHLEKAIELIYRKDLKKARNELKTLLHSFPQETEILARARSYILICDREESAQRKMEKSAEQLYALGVMEHNNARYDAAINYYLQSMKSNPDLDYIYYSIAASQAMKGDLSESLKNLGKAIELNRDSRIYARNDHDFDVFQENKEFAELLGFARDHDSEIP